MIIAIAFSATSGSIAERDAHAWKPRPGMLKGRLSNACYVVLNKIRRKKPILVGPYGDPIKVLPGGKKGRFIVGLMAGAGKKFSRRASKQVFAAGEEITASGNILLTGACNGVPGIGTDGAKKDGKGLVIGISPWRTVKEHIKRGARIKGIDVLKLTELPPVLRKYRGRPNLMGREIDNIEHSDAIMIVGGRFGTLGELAIALSERRPVGVLTGTKGIS